MQSDSTATPRETDALLRRVAPSDAAAAADNGRRQLESRLYISHTLSAWNSRLFEFGAVLFLASIFPDTLLPMSVYALARSVAAVALAHPVGAWIDRGNRLAVVRASIVGQRLPVAASCGILWLLEQQQRPGGGMMMATGSVAGWMALLCALAGAEKVAAMANTIAVERDWVVVMTGEDDGWRRVINARMRRIDLLCKLLGPLAISIIATVSTRFAIGATLAMNVASVFLEYGCIAKNAASPSATARFKTFITAIVPVGSLSDYFRHSAFLPSFSLSLLYLTVLSFSGQFITFLLSIGFTPLHVGIARTGSTVIELSATWAAPRLMNYMGPVRGGIWSLSWQMICLTLGLSVFLRDGFGSEAHHAWTSVSGLIVCIALSRLGLWGYDLCAQTIVQEEVEDGNRGAFSSVEASFQNLFELLSFATTIAFSRPEQFHWPLVISIAAVYVAGGLNVKIGREKVAYNHHRKHCFNWLVSVKELGVRLRQWRRFCVLAHTAAMVGFQKGTTHAYLRARVTRGQRRKTVHSFNSAAAFAREDSLDRILGRSEH
ncbi:iron-regulated transporter, putative [Cordyceps militaris CM01]|uniref:Solute carrier family 40 member n=1 Tax=Cordyceps militaris (strain CM01) TaxID=983644 RepID=G3JMA2_CORMM|nr:iron-regulated transporter, putative [Cordyceps militaris CM01]EGX89990.1 iron-regulated transporter, putative [Cordyceps militaris CM01]